MSNPNRVVIAALNQKAPRPPGERGGGGRGGPGGGGGPRNRGGRGQSRGSGGVCLSLLMVRCFSVSLFRCYHLCVYLCIYLSLYLYFYRGAGVCTRAANLARARALARPGMRASAQRSPPAHAHLRMSPRLRLRLRRRPPKLRPRLLPRQRRLPLRRPPMLRPPRRPSLPACLLARPPACLTARPSRAACPPALRACPKVKEKKKKKKAALSRSLSLSLALCLSPSLSLSLSLSLFPSLSLSLPTYVHMRLCFDRSIRIYQYTITELAISDRSTTVHAHVKHCRGMSLPCGQSVKYVAQFSNLKEAELHAIRSIHKLIILSQHFLEMPYGPRSP